MPYKSAKDQNKLTIGYNFQSVIYHISIKKFFILTFVPNSAYGLT